MPDRITLDHVAHAVESHDLVLPRYAVELGGRYVGSGPGPGFWPLQVRFANGGKLEILQPHQAEVNPFLRRFLDQRGPGLHHVTFKVPDIREAIATVEGAGYAVVDVDLSGHWKEAFIHPKAALGFLVQLAQDDDAPWPPPPPDFPTPARPADLVRVVLTIASLDAGTALYRDTLGGDVVDEGEGWIDIEHGADTRLRLRSPSDPSELGGLPGRADHLVFRADDPWTVDGAVDVDGRWEVPAADNHGARLVFTSH